LDLLLEAGDVARETGSDVVTEAHVQKARERVQTDQVVEGIQELLPTRETCSVRTDAASRAR